MEVWEIPSVTTNQRKYRGRKRQMVTRETEPGVSPNKQKRSMKLSIESREERQSLNLGPEELLRHGQMLELCSCSLPLVYT